MQKVRGRLTRKKIYNVMVGSLIELSYGYECFNLNLIHVHVETQRRLVQSHFEGYFKLI